MKHCDCRSVGSPADFATSPDTLRTLADDHRLCEMPAKFRWAMQWAAAEIARLRLTDEEREAIEWCAERWHTPQHTRDTIRRLLERMK